MPVMETTALKLYAVREKVFVSGNYLCVPCGYIQYFEAGATFGPCLACFAGTSDGPVGYQTPESEFWQFIG